MKKILFFLLLFLLSIPLFSFQSLLEKRDDLFNISEELEAFNKEELTNKEKEYYDSCNIYLLTGGPGSLLWENFGHTSLVLSTPSSRPLTFDYGLFTFDDSFYINFILGKLYYTLDYGSLSFREKSLVDDDRDVTLLPLTLNEEEKKNIFSFMYHNVKDENKTYLYEYFTDNCATRPRDIYSWATGGKFEEYAKSIPSPETLRSSSMRYLSHSSFFPCYALNYLMGPMIDKKVSMWEMCYLPEILNKVIEDFQNNKGEVVYKSKERKDTPSSYSLTLPSILLAVVLVLLSLLSQSKRGIRRVGSALLSLIYLIFGIMSLLLLFFMCFTIHVVTYNNVNILIISPLCIVLCILHILSLGKKRRNKAIGIISIISFLLSFVVMLLLLIVPNLIQDSSSPLISVMPLYAVESLSFIIPLIKKKKDYLSRVTR